MSTNSELKALFARLGPARDASPVRSFSAETEPVLLRRTGRFDQRIGVAHRLRDAGLSLKAAHTAITELAARDWWVCDIPVDADIDSLAADLAPLDVSLSRRRPPADPVATIADIRARHALSQREFANALGVDVRTLQNWEQGRNLPDTAVLTLMAIYDRNPEAVADALFEPAALPQRAAAE